MILGQAITRDIPVASAFVRQLRHCYYIFDRNTTYDTQISHIPIIIISHIIMRNFTRNLLLCCLSVAATGANATQQPVLQGADISNLVYKSESKHNVFGTRRSANIEKLNLGIRSLSAKNTHKVSEKTVTPSTSFTSLDKFSDMDVAGGGLWFYTIAYDMEYITHNEYWTESRIKGFEIKIYDNNFKLISTLKDKIRMNDDEVRPVIADIIPVATRHFFNDDDDVEIMFSLGLNTTTPGTNHYRTNVYKLNGNPVDGDGNCVPVYTIDDIVSDVLDATPEGGDESIFITFANEQTPDIDYDNIQDPESFDWWNDYSMKIFVNLSTYTKVGADGKLTKVMDKQIRLLEMPGDQENTPVFMSMLHDGKPYLVCSHYALPFSNDYNINDYTTDVTMRDGNSLVVEIYRIDGMTPVLEQTTTVPAPLTDGAIFSYYSVGDLMYRNDVMMSEPGKANLLVTRSDVHSAAEEEGTKTYSVYNYDGTLKNTLISDCEGAVALSDIEGFDTQYMFIRLNGSTYEYHFIDIESANEVLNIDYKISIDGSDPDPLSATMERVPYGNSYRYVNEMVYPVEDEDISYMRFAWLDDKGQYLDQHWLNMGTGVNYARSYLSQECLKKGFFATADDMAYMVLIKRATESLNLTEELLIGHPVSEDNPMGKDLLLLGQCEKGSLVTISPINFGDSRKLMVSYTNGQAGSPYTVDFYDLPLDSDAGVDDIEADNTQADAIVYDGTTITCAGKFAVYDAQGRLTFRAADSADATALAPGLYIVVTEAATRKIAVK